jgi:hypothetical protein
MVLFLRGYYGKHPKVWDEQIPYVHHAYNLALYSSTQCYPFETCFGYLPKVPLDFMYEEINEDRSRNFIQRIQQVHQAIKEHLEKTQAQYKSRHDKHRVDHHVIAIFSSPHAILHIRPFSISLCRLVIPFCKSHR